MTQTYTLLHLASPRSLSSHSTEVYGDIIFEVMDTDYDTWTSLYSCSPSLFGRMHAGLVLARETKLDLPTLMKAREALAVSCGTVGAKRK